MSNPEDVVINNERKARIEGLEFGVRRLHTRAHMLILEANELQKLADKLRTIEDVRP
jgi:translation elongation factor EF-1beta